MLAWINKQSWVLFLTFFIVVHSIPGNTSQKNKGGGSLHMWWPFIWWSRKWPDSQGWAKLYYRYRNSVLQSAFKNGASLCILWFQGGHGWPKSIHFKFVQPIFSCSAYLYIMSGEWKRCKNMGTQVCPQKTKTSLNCVLSKFIVFITQSILTVFIILKACWLFS